LGAAPSINIVGLDNGAGLSADARLLQTILQMAGCRAHWFRGLRPEKWITRLHRLKVPRWLLPSYDVNLFLEFAHPGWFPFAKLNVLIPNPEWFREEQHAHLSGIDLVLCKTVDAQRAFQALGKRTFWAGFTAEDRGGHMLAAMSRPMRALHVAGRSEHKGTRQVIDTWERHPEWPELTVVQRALDEGTPLYAPQLPNVRYFSERLSDEAVVALQRDHAIYILPSEVEGYGQSLVEGMSLGAIVVTTDAAPMNELVTPDRGVLVQARAGEPFRLGNRYQVIASELERALADVLTWSPERCERIGSAARAWYVQNDRRFRAEFPQVLATLLTDSPVANPPVRGDGAS
jgi:glycosyltransferase involved in cell wall biosynthesis